MSDADRNKRGREITRPYTDAEKERALFAVALCSGNCERAAKGLAEHDEKYAAPDARTLRRWKAQHSELYSRVESDALPRVRAELASEFTDLARAELNVTRKLLSRLDSEADALAPRDLAGAIRNLKVSGAVGVDKAQLLRGEPTEIKQNRSSAEILRALKDRYGVEVVDGTAEDVTDADVVA